MTEPKFQVTKTYTHSIGLSACFRQWRAVHSHCQYLHGYALQVKIVFESEHLDVRNWVMDFGGLKLVKTWLEQTFDHKTLVAKDDPLIKLFARMEQAKLIDLVYVDAVGCEAFAKMIYDKVVQWLNEGEFVCADKTIVRYVEVREHDSNSAIYGTV